MGKSVVMGWKCWKFHGGLSLKECGIFDDS